MLYGTKAKAKTKEVNINQIQTSSLVRKIHVNIFVHVLINFRWNIQVSSGEDENLEKKLRERALNSMKKKEAKGGESDGESSSE